MNYVSSRPMDNNMWTCQSDSFQ